MLFSVWKDERVWVPWNHSFDMYLSCLGPVSQRSHPVSSVHPWRGEVAAVADVPCGHPLSILSSLGVHRQGDCNVKAWWAATSLVYWYDRWHFSSTVFHFINQKTEKINALHLLASNRLALSPSPTRGHLMLLRWGCWIQTQTWDKSLCPHLPPRAQLHVPLWALPMRANQGLLQSGRYVRYMKIRAKMWHTS